MPPLVESRFAAMGTDVHVIAVGGGSRDLSYAHGRIERLEAMWSRFRPDSEVGRLNAAAGEPVPVSLETISLLRLALEARVATGGLFDPTVLEAMVAIGYDRSFENVAVGLPAMAGYRPHEPAEIVIDQDRCTAAVASGSGFDPGGIGKGYAADLVVEGLLGRPGVRGACVNLGGDLRVAGEGPDGGPWIVEVEDPFGGKPIGRIAIEEGAVATTTRVKRRWIQGSIDRHHIIDPRTGLPGDSGLAAVTVVAGEAWWAEAVAKAALLAGVDDAPRVVLQAGAEGLAIDDDGAVLRLGELPVLVA